VVTKEAKPGTQQAEGQAGQGTTAAPGAPYLGRSVRIVAPVVPVDAAQTPHEKNKRGELGKPLFNWYFNRASHDPLGRSSSANGAADRRNVLAAVVGRARKGDVNPVRTEAPDPVVMTQHIKRVARFLGASAVGIAAVNPAYLYSAGRYPDDPVGGEHGSGLAESKSPEETAKKYPFAIACVLAWDYNLGRAHRHRIGDAAYHFSQAQNHVTYANLAGYIRELGYSAIQSHAQPMPIALAAGLGEIGRHGMLITEKHGSRVHLGDPILTDMPLVPDKPLDIGVEDYCKICKKCATTCPTNSISMGDKVVYNGVEKYKIIWETCYRLRAHVMAYWEICLTCVAVCPYTKPNAWWRTLAVESLKKTPILLRPLVVWPLKWIDDIFWGKVPRKRVQWMSYDSGVIPSPKAGNGAKRSNGSAGEAAPQANGKHGYYFPLKENTRRFEILEKRTRDQKSSVGV
jgi:reductive dehalogenase